MNIDQPLIGRSGHNQKSLCIIPTLERNATDRSHEYWLAISTMNEIGLLLVAFTLPFKPAIGKTNCSPMLPQRFKHSAAGCGLNPGINQWWFIPPPWRVTPEDRIKVQLFVAFAKEQNLCPWRHIVTSNRLRIVCNVALGFIRQVCQVFFTGLGLRKTSTHRNLQSVRLKV